MCLVLSILAPKFPSDEELPNCRQGNVAGALNRSKLNHHLQAKLSKSQCTFGKTARGNVSQFKSVGTVKDCFTLTRHCLTCTSK